MNSNRRTFLKLGTIGVAAAALQSLGFACSSSREAPTADDASSNVATQWFELLYDVVKAERTSPPAAARVYGVTAVALHESVVAGTKKRRSLAGQLNDLSAMPEPASSDLNWQAVANAAVARTVRGLYPSLSQASIDAVNGLEQRLAAEAGSMTWSGDERSVEYGQTVADTILEWSARDGFTMTRGAPYRPSAQAGDWAPTPPQFNPNPLEPAWGEMRPMVLRSGNELRPEGHPPFQVDPGSAFYRAALEVYNVGRALTPEQKTIADYWADGPGATGTPPGHWVAIVSQVARNDALSLTAAAEAYARVGIAVHDAFICCWNAKYAYNLLRPVSYINQVIDPDWTTYIATPNFPAYTSGHSSQSSAAALVLTDMFGNKSFQDTTHVDHGLQPAQAPRSFASFDEAAAEAAISRLYGGIHYVFDNDDGLKSGQLIGEKILQRVSFKA